MKLIAIMATGKSQQYLWWRGSFNLSGPAYLFYPLLSIWMVLISQMENDILHHWCWILLRNSIGWKGIRMALPASQTSAGLFWNEWALHQCCHQTPFLRRGVATLNTNNGSTCLSYGPTEDTRRQPLTILYKHSSYADCDKGPILAHLNHHVTRLMEEEFVLCNWKQKQFPIDNLPRV